MVKITYTTRRDVTSRAEAVLTLRVVISNGDFEEYWRFHLICEHQRLSPAPGRASTRSEPDQLGRGLLNTSPGRWARIAAWIWI